MVAREWVIKASKFCNMRCLYCYEWDELSDPRRIQPDLWRKILAAAHYLQELGSSPQDEEPAGQTKIIWHGGEPLILPPDYFAQVISMQREIFGDDCLENGRVGNWLQTNLYSWRPDLIQALRGYGFRFGVSLDYAPGVRLSAAGQPTEERVLNNLRRLREMGVHANPIVVVAGHTAPNLVDIYKSIRDAGHNFQLLPLFLGSDQRPMDHVAIGPAAIVDAMFRVFVAWYEDSCSIEIKPLSGHLQTVMMKLAGLERPLYNRRVDGDSVLVVDTDGGLYQACDPYGPQTLLGNLDRQTMPEILASDAYRQSLARNDVVRSKVCSKCSFFGPCSTYPMFGTNDGYADQGQCLVTRPLLGHIEAYLREQGVSDSFVSDLLIQSLPVELSS